MTNAQMRKSINSVYRRVRASLPNFRLIINDRMGYVSVDFSGGNLYYMEGDEAFDFMKELDAASEKFNVDYDHAAAWILDSAGEI
jgi:hypothetical protein